MKLTIDQRSPEWLSLRRSKIGASDIPIIMGSSPWGSINSLAKEKRLGSSNFVSSAMQHGIDSESYILDQVEVTIGRPLERSPVYVHDEKPFVMASLDGITTDGKMVIEAKAPKAENHAKHKQYGVPLYYYQQMQWQMYACGAKEAVFSSWCDGDLYLEDVAYDEETVNELLIRGEEFYNKYILGDEPIKGLEDIASVDDSDWQDIQMEYLQLQDDKKPLLDALKILEEKEVPLKNAMSKIANGRSVAGTYLKLQVMERKSALDEDRLSKAGINVEEFRKKPISYLKISRI